MSSKFILSALVLFSIVTVFWIFKRTLEGFEGMRPWFGYEPGYGPGWGRKGCCNTATEESIRANNLS